MASKMVREYLAEDWQFEIPTSFIDCVFLLLIFFLLTARFKSLENALAASMPRHEGVPRDDRVEPPSEIRVKLFWQDSAGRVVRDRGGRGEHHLALRANNIPCADLNDLAGKLALLGARNPSMPVVIDARSRVPFKWVLGAVDASARAGLAHVRFQAPPALGGGGDDWWWY